MPDPISVICAYGEVHGLIEPPAEGAWRVEVSDGSVIEAAEGRLIVIKEGSGLPDNDGDRAVAIGGAVRWIAVVGTDLVYLPTPAANNDGEIDSIIAWDDRYDPEWGPRDVDAEAEAALRAAAAADGA